MVRVRLIRDGPAGAGITVVVARTLILLMLAAPVIPAVAQGVGLDTVAVARAFAAARAVAADDGGRLWGRSLAGPLLVADPASMMMFASTGDTAGALESFGSMFRAPVPPSITPANTAVSWNGRRWTMVRWPLPIDPTALRELVAHELWHRIQDSLGLVGRERSNGHLEREWARVWLRLEVRALARSLSSGGGGAERIEALIDGLSFRAARYRAFPGADTTEAILELNEGLAAYTGIKLSGRTIDEQRARAVRGLRELEQSEAVVRSFAYATGPAYGLMLDEFRPGWRMDVQRAVGLSQLLVTEFVDRLASGDGLTTAADRYRLTEVRVAESARAERKALRRRDLIAQFVTGPRLSAPLRQMRIGLDPDRVESLDSLGSVYGAARITDEWGALDARAGQLRIGAEWTEATVPLPIGYRGAAEGPGWKLDLRPGWRVVRAGPDLWRIERVPEDDGSGRAASAAR